MRNSNCAAARRCGARGGNLASRRSIPTDRAATAGSHARSIPHQAREYDAHRNWAVRHLHRADEPSAAICSRKSFCGWTGNMRSNGTKINEKMANQTVSRIEAPAGDQPVLCARGPAGALAPVSPGFTTGPRAAPGPSMVSIVCEACIGWMSWPVNVRAIGSWMP
jgi:hypothetical protein